VSTSPAASPSALGSAWQVALGSAWQVGRREYVERVRDRTFLISTAFVVVVLVMITWLPSLLGTGERPSWTVALAGTGSAALAERLPAAGGALGADLRTVTVPDRAAAEARLRSEGADLAVVDGQLIALRRPDQTLVAAVGAAAGQVRLRAALAEAGARPEAVDAALAQPPPQVTTLEPAGPREAEAVARFGSFLLYFQLITYGSWVAAGVVEEKASRVVELILAAVRPSQLLAGKVAGIGLLGLTQLVLLAAIGLTAATAFGAVEVPASMLGPIASVVAWFVLGYAFWAGAWAVAGAIVSRQEELQNTSTPLVLIMVAAFLVALLVGEDPGSLAARVASFVPPVAPLVMPVRMAVGAVAAWEVAASVLVTVAATVALVPLAARIYAGAVLRTGSRVRLRQVLAETRRRRAPRRLPDQA
jgi:ABC-2 type transport system permease protein